MPEPSTPDPVFAAFVEAGLWPGLGRTTGAALPEAGVVSAADVGVAALRRVPRMLGSRAERLVTSFYAAAEAYDLVALLLPHGLPPRLAGPLAKLCGPGAAAAVGTDPWRVLEVPGVRLADADRFARALLPGVQPGDPRRGRALVVHELAEAASEGSTCLAVPDLAERLPPGALEATADDLRVHVEDGLVALAPYATAEQSVADGLVRLAALAEPVATPAAVGAVADDLDEAQRRAVAAALEHGVSVLTGGPGTGKSRTVAALVRLATARGQRVALAAPTGRAAKRLEELCGEPAATLHRLLGAQGLGAGGFARGEQWPLDADLVVVDEASMLDAELAAALVEACADGCHLLLVGDPAQLPSIGPGRVLGDVVDSRVVPVTELTTLYRQAEGGAIARLATAVRGGELPRVEPDPAKRGRRRRGERRRARRRTARCSWSATRSPARSASPAPTCRSSRPCTAGRRGRRRLNAALKARLNPGDGEVGGFDVGDRVVATANHLEDGFANGEVGVVTAARSGTLTVAFAGAGPVEVPPRAVGDLAHGWAVTVHRAQGSEFPAVVAVVPPEAGAMLSRPLVYTAFTRAQKHLSVVHAAGPALSRAVRDVGARPRRTRLVALLREAAEVADLAVGSPDEG